MYAIVEKVKSGRPDAEDVNTLTKDIMYITVKMYPCSGGTDTGSPEL